MFVPKGNPMKAGSWEEEPPGQREAATTKHSTKGRRRNVQFLALLPTSLLPLPHGQARAGGLLGDAITKGWPSGYKAGQKKYG